MAGLRVDLSRVSTKGGVRSLALAPAVRLARFPIIVAVEALTIAGLTAKDRSSSGRTRGITTLPIVPLLRRALPPEVAIAKKQ